MGTNAVLTPDFILARAKQLREGPPATQMEFLGAAQDLMRYHKWLEAAALWEMARGSRTLERDPRIDTLSIAQQAMCISKERAELSLDEAFARAITVLETGELETTTDQETLGIAGGIYKRYWDTFRQQQHLQQSFAYYERGWQAGGINDDGYTGINAAYVADVIAYVEETIARRGGAPSTSAQQRRRAAYEYRQAIIGAETELEARAGHLEAQRPPFNPSEHPWWIRVTLAEAHFGLAPHDGTHYSHAVGHLRRAMALPAVPPWMVETTARQLGAMARMQEAARPGTAGLDSRPWQVLDELVRHVPGLRTELGGKVGLALSGGGFRASLFHIGVLARLAELDMLRHVEVLSCVSGGSILGAAYYLRLRELLNEKRDDEIDVKDYLAIVRQLEHDFLRAIQENNFRMRMLENFSTNLGMLTNRASRTEALGRTMGRELYGSDTVWMEEVPIQPPDGEHGFRPVDYNWRRRNKVPLLVLNATNQAGGHPWHFTPYEMGEPRLSAVDTNPRLRRRAYSEGFRAHLWRAVSASACVPVLFDPIRVTFDDAHVNLLDGGVHDNQGTSALLDHDCTLLLVSDASGQLSNDANASTSFASVGLRADAIVQERLRIALYEALEARRSGSLLRGLMFLHLRSGLGDTEDAPTPYGISTAVQRRISAIRTDLDTFNDVEALSLMVSGYRMAGREFPAQLTDIATPPPTEHDWAFRELEPKLTAGEPDPRLLAILDLSGQRLLKAWRAVPALKWTGRLLVAAAAVAALLVLLALLQSDRVIRVSSLASASLIALAGVLIERLLRVKMPSWKRDVAFIATALTGAVLAWLHAKWLDPAYLRAGRRDYLQ